MIKNFNGTLIYMTIPSNYEYVYKELLNKIVGVGQGVIGDSSKNCKTISSNLINCWNVFQGACASYNLGRTKESDHMISYITSQLNITIKEMTCNPNYIYYGHTDVDPNVFKTIPVGDLINSPDTHFKDLVIDNKEFTIKQVKSIHYLLVPVKYIELVNVEYGKGVVTNLWDKEYPLDGAYNTDHPGGVYGDTYYKVFFSYSPIGAISDDIRITVDNK